MWTKLKLASPARPSTNGRAQHPPWTPLNLTELNTIPGPARWHVYHRRCDPQTASQNDYWFDIERARTDRDLLAWTAHLLDKDWLRDTNWACSCTAP